MSPKDKFLTAFDDEWPTRSLKNPVVKHKLSIIIFYSLVKQITFSVSTIGM